MYKKTLQRDFEITFRETFDGGVDFTVNMYCCFRSYLVSQHSALFLHHVIFFQLAFFFASICIYVFFTESLLGTNEGNKHHCRHCLCACLMRFFSIYHFRSLHLSLSFARTLYAKCGMNCESHIKCSLPTIRKSKQSKCFTKKKRVNQVSLL